MSTTTLLQSTESALFAHYQISHTPPHPVTHMVASNMQIALVLANKSIQRVNQARRDTSHDSALVETVDLSKAIGHAKVHRAFLDPLGAHLVLSLKPTDPEAQPDLLYLNRKSTRHKMSSKIRGNLVTAVAWNSSNSSESNTAPILIGTSRGVIFETELDSGEERIFSTGLESSWRQVFDIGKGQHSPITGLEFHLVPHTRGKYIIIATTQTRMYQFQGNVSGGPEERPLLLGVFSRYLNVPEKFIELPGIQARSLSSNSPSLTFFYSARERGKPISRTPLFPASFGWLVGAGVYAGNVDAHFADDTVTVDCELVSFGTEAPLAFLVTEFHILLAYEHKIRGVCILNQQTVFEYEVDPGEGKIKGLARDPIRGVYYAYTDYAIHRFQVDREERNVWRIYLEKGDFDRALQFCSGDDQKLDEVQVRKAEALFTRGEFLDSAMHYAKTQKSFEEIALKFVQLEDKRALLNYLKKKLEAVRGGDRAQMTMIVVWIVDTYLSDLNRLTIAGDSEGHEQVRQEFESVLKTSKISECIGKNKGTLYRLLGEHGSKDNLVKLAAIMDDHEKLVELYLQEGEYEPILKILREQRKPALYYKHGAVLMQTVPALFIDAVLDQGRRLTPSKLIPALVTNAGKAQEVEGMRYLEFCVQRQESGDPAVHNYLVHLYIKYSPAKLAAYLEEQGYDKESVPYDIKYTLTLCQKAGLKDESVSLLCILGQLEEAVELALDVDLEAAKRCLRFAKDDQDIKKKIWMRIARYVVQKRNDIKQAMEYLQQCDGLVKIEDILPFFPDFVTIDHFKGAICDSLQDYSKHIQDLRSEMEESNQAADRIRAEISQSKNEYLVVRATDTCKLCSAYLMMRPFHLFNCGHFFHTDCLTDEVAKYLTPARKRRLDELSAEMSQLKAQSASRSAKGEDVASVDSKGTSGPRLSRKDQLRSELDDLMASQCLYCGDLMVKMIDKPLVEDADFEREMAEWL